MPYRATRTEPRVAVGNYTGDFRKGQVVDLGDKDPEGNIAAYLVEQGLFIEVDDNAVDNEWFDSEDPELANNDLPEAEADSFDFADDPVE